MVERGGEREVGETEAKEERENKKMHRRSNQKLDLVQLKDCKKYVTSTSTSTIIMRLRNRKDTVLVSVA